MISIKLPLVLSSNYTLCSRHSQFLATKDTWCFPMSMSLFLLISSPRMPFFIFSTWWYPVHPSQAITNATILVKPVQIPPVFTLTEWIPSGLYSSLLAFIRLYFISSEFYTPGGATYTHTLIPKHITTHYHHTHSVPSSVIQPLLWTRNQETWALVPGQPLCNVGQVTSQELWFPLS